MSFAGHNFVAWSGKGLICEKCGIVTMNSQSQGLLGRCYDLAGVLEGIHSSHCLTRFHLSDGSVAIACGKCGNYSLNKQVRLRERCTKHMAGDGIKFFTKKVHPKKVGIHVENMAGIFRRWNAGDKVSGNRSRLNKRRAWRRDELDPRNTVVRRPNVGNGPKGEGGSSGSGSGPGGSHMAMAVEKLRKRRRLVAPVIPGNGVGAANMLAELRDQAEPGGDAG